MIAMTSPAAPASAQPEIVSETTQTGQRLSPRLLGLFALFAIWVGFLVWMAVSYANPPRINEAQLHQASWIVLAEVIKISDVNSAKYEVSLAEVLKHPEAEPSLTITTLTGPEGLLSGQKYFFPLEQTAKGEFYVVPAAIGGSKKNIPLNYDFGSGYVVSPEIEGFGTPFVYPDQPAYRSQIEAFLKD